MADALVGKKIYHALDYWTVEKVIPLVTAMGTEKRARALYEQIPTPKPKWEQLGQVTQQEWKCRAKKGSIDDAVHECTLVLDRMPSVVLHCFLRYPEDFNQQPQIKKPLFKKPLPKGALFTKPKPKLKPKPKPKPLAFKLRGY